MQFQQDIRDELAIFRKDREKLAETVLCKRSGFLLVQRTGCLLFFLKKARTPTSIRMFRMLRRFECLVLSWRNEDL